MSALARVCVFCGSSMGTSSRYRAVAAELGSALATAGTELVYGGNVHGLMGVLADAALAAGGAVTGVIPTGVFSTEVPHRGLTSLIEVGSMHERKQRMYSLSDGFVALPGGLGTLEEVAEIATWAQLGMHARPIVVLDVDGYWGPLLGWLDQAVAEGFITRPNRGIIASAATVAGVLRALGSPGGPGERAGLSIGEA